MRRWWGVLRGAPRRAPRGVSPLPTPEQELAGVPVFGLFALGHEVFKKYDGGYTHHATGVWLTSRQMLDAVTRAPRGVRIIRAGGER